ncbi:hypothetical protein [Pseudoxanthomonas kalamensis]|uniref:hypothetical protein n=1 Tax=Pseudoxanthomonas kalamensis TaxID=289483 RepID=UPI00139142FB|nr:hypothetical protein [Pseudoxanthomonas kalamensis]
MDRTVAASRAVMSLQTFDADRNLPGKVVHSGTTRECGRVRARSGARMTFPFHAYLFDF